MYLVEYLVLKHIKTLCAYEYVMLYLKGRVINKKCIYFHIVSFVFYTDDVLPCKHNINHDIVYMKYTFVLLSTYTFVLVYNCTTYIVTIKACLY